MLIEFIRVTAELWPLGNALAFKFEEFRLYRAGDRSDDLILQFEQIGKVTVVPLGKKMVAGVGADQLRGDTHSPARFAHAALKHVTHA